MKDYLDWNTKISESGGTSTSYKTTIPKEIIKKMEVKKGDYVTWRLYDGERIIAILNPKEVVENNKNTILDIDVTSEKTIKKEVTTKEDSTDENNQTNTFKTENFILSTELGRGGKYAIRIRDINNQTKSILKKQIGTETETLNKLKEISNSDLEVVQFIFKYGTEPSKEKIEKMGFKQT